jgi:hypothetical protein
MTTPKLLHGLLAAALAVSTTAVAQNAITKSPTAADWAAMAKLPDFNGVWEAGGGGGGARGAAGAGAARGTAAPAGRGTAGGPPPGAAAAGVAARGGAGAGGGGRGRGGGQAGPPLTPEYAAKAKNMPPPSADGATANCLPPGLPTIMNQPYPMEFLLTPGKVTIVIEAYTQVRHIYTDGRPLPADPDPSFYGTSVGHWDGDTLVVETVGFEDVPRGINFPHSDKMKIVERFHLTDPDSMTVETSVVDPEALTMPYAMGARTLRRHRNWTIAEYICEENNRNFVDSQGKAGINLSNPLASPK